jgi:Spy/CpxP family protein refolding chaperone
MSSWTWKAGLAGIAIIAATASAVAQMSPGHHGMHGNHMMHAQQHQQPYASFEARAIKALSDQQVRELKEGLGMGLALAAELNGYPGPRHAVELAGPLGLSDAQRTKVNELFAAMKAESIPLGEKLIEQEAELDRQFANKSITAASLAASTQAIGSTQAALRATHLKFHLLTNEVLTPAQAGRYAELRGYAKAEHDPAMHGRR